MSPPEKGLDTESARNNLPDQMLRTKFAPMSKRKIDTVERVRAKLQGANLSAVARDNAMSVRQVRNIRDRKTLKPLWDTMVKLTAYFGVPMA